MFVTSIAVIAFGQKKLSIVVTLTSSK